MEVDEDGGPDGLEAGFTSASVAALAGVVAVDEQAEQPFNPWAGPAEVLAGRWVFERFAAGLQEVFAAADLELPAASARRAAALERAAPADSITEDRGTNA